MAMTAVHAALEHDKEEAGETDDPGAAYRRPIPRFADLDFLHRPQCSPSILDHAILM